MRRCWSSSIPRWHCSGDASRGFVAAHFGAPGAETAVDKALRLDSTVMLVDDPVKRVDNMTMAWGLEARVPFLDHELVELAARIPPALKLKDGGKGVLKDVGAAGGAARGHRPAQGLLPGAAAEVHLRAVPGHGQGSADRRCRPGSAACSAAATWTQLFAEPEKHITPLRGSALWQVALLELWLQNHGI